MIDADVSRFTPVKPQNWPTLTTQRHRNDSKVWTTAQCQRLLRPITSRIEVLKKDSVHRKPNTTATTTPRKPPADLAQISNPTAQFTTDDEDNDPEWGPSRKLSRIKRTYGRSHSSQELTNRKKVGSHLAPGEISIPTPVLNRTILATDLGAKIYVDQEDKTKKTKFWRRPLARYATKDGEAHFHLAESMRRIARSTHAPRFALYEGLYNALETLLKTTMPNSSTEELRPRSLLSTCLRNVPRYVEIEEAWAASQAGEISTAKSTLNPQNITAEIYSDLESMGTSDRGWKHLKTVVRAHGVHIIAGAIADQLIDTDFASALVMLCVHTASPLEAEQLLSPMLQKEYPEPTSVQSRMSENAEMLGLTTLSTFVKHTGNWTYYYRKMSQLITERQLPTTWLATRDFSPLWTGLFRSLSSGLPSSNDAFSFLGLVLPTICKETTKIDKLSSGLQATLASAIRTLVSMCILSQTHTTVQDSVRFSSLKDLLGYMMIDCGVSSAIIDNIGLSLVAISNLIISDLGNPDMSQPSESFLPFAEVIIQGSKESRSANDYEEYISQFLCSIARCCGRCSTDNGFQHLQGIVDRVQTLIAVDLVDAGHVLRRVAVETTVAYAQQLPGQNHAHYAEQTQITLLGPPTQLRSPTRGTASKAGSGLRWEEGISEWVAATPAIRPRKTEVGAIVSSDEESECESPFKISLNEAREPAASRRGVPRVTRQRCPRNRISELAPSSPDVNDSPVYIYTSVTARSNESFGCRFRREIFKSEAREPVNKRRRYGDQVSGQHQVWRLLDSESSPDLTSSSLSPLDSNAEILAELPNSRRYKHDHKTRFIGKSLSPGPSHRTIESMMDMEDSADELSLL